MFKKFRVSLRVQFLIIALSLAVTSIILNMSAYLTDKDTYSQTFHTAAGSELGFRLSGEEYDDLSLIPGSTVDLNVKASSENGVELYLFIKLDIPADFELIDFYSLGWHPISDDSNIYFFGNSEALIALGGPNGIYTPVLQGVKLSVEAEGGKNYELIITGYAIQAANIPHGTKPANVFSMIGEQ